MPLRFLSWIGDYLFRDLNFNDLQLDDRDIFNDLYFSPEEQERLRDCEPRMAHFSATPRFTLDNQMPLINDLKDAVSFDGVVDLELLRSYRDRIEKTTENPELKAKAVSILNKVEAQRMIEDRLKDYPALKNFPREQLWRMFLDGKHQEARGEYGFENEMGYMAGLMNGFLKVLDTLEQPLDSTSYEGLHDLAIGGVYDTKGPKLAVPENRMQAQFRPASFPIDDGNNGTYDQPLRVHFGLKDGINGSPEGMEEFEQRKLAEEEQGVSWFSEYRAPKEAGDGVIQCAPKSPEEIKIRVDRILGTFNEAIAEAESEDEKLTAMARCCQDLDQSHVFSDGNIRTIVFLVLNKMLLENHMDPVIMDEPNVFDGFSTEQLVAQIKLGQEKFRSYLPT